MTDDQIDDLKQFIVITVSQATSHLASKDDLDTGLQDLRGELRSGLQRLEEKVDSGFAGVGEAIEQIHQILEERDEEIDKRFTKLEQKMA